MLRNIHAFGDAGDIFLSIPYLVVAALPCPDLESYFLGRLRQEDEAIMTPVHSFLSMLANALRNTVR